MAEMNDSVSLDVETIYLGGKEYHVKTAQGSVSVIVYGDRDKPGLVTYPDLALNHMSCFQGLFFYPEAASLLLHNFCIYHISPPGHELGAAAVCSNDSVPSAENLADQILEVLNFFRLDTVMCMGATAGAYILNLFATKHKERVLGLILVSPLCKAPSWTEWLYNKVMSNLLYFYGMCGLVKECLLKRYFSQEIRGNAEVPESDIVQACRRLLDERQSLNVLRFLEAMNGRSDISDSLNKLQCRTLIFVGDESPFYSEAIHMMSKLDKRCSALVEVQACGSMVTEEQPYAMLVPMEYFLMGYGLYRPSQLKGSPRSPLSPTCISPDLLSPESMGLKLKPIKTRVSSLANRMMEELHSQGKTTEDIAQCLTQTPLEPQIVSAIKAAHAAGCELRIVSDANQFFIETILKHHGLLSCFTEIITNPSLIDEQGKLRIFPFHDSASSPHGCSCKFCPSNMCKGLILEQMQASIGQGCNSTFIYLGDGGGDYCPSLKLGNGDHVMPRKNYPLSECIKSNPKLVQAQVHEWSNAEEFYNTLVYLISKVLTADKYEFETSQLGSANSDLVSLPVPTIL